MDAIALIARVPQNREKFNCKTDVMRTSFGHAVVFDRRCRRSTVAAFRVRNQFSKRASTKSSVGSSPPAPTSVARFVASIVMPQDE